MTGGGKVRVLIAEDHPVVRDGLKLLVERRPDMEVVGLACGGEEAIRLHLETRPDVTLMDLRLPGTTGLQALEAIRREAPDARVIVLTTFDSDEDIYRSLRAGARAYLLKNVATEVLIETIRAVHAGQTRIPPEIAGRLQERLPGNELFPREREVLELLVEGRSNREIGLELGLAESTVKWYLTTVFGKLGVRDRTQAVAAALGRGLVRRP